jgi:hypothetical protein
MLEFFRTEKGLLNLHEFDNLSSRLIVEIVGQTKSEFELSELAFRPYFFNELVLLNSELEEYFDYRIEEICDEVDNFFDRIDELVAEEVDEEFRQTKQDQVFLKYEWPIIEVDVPKMTEKDRKRGLGKKGRLLAERRYVASRANKFRIGYKSGTKKGETADSKWMTARLRRSAREMRGLDVSFAEITQKDREERSGRDPWTLQFIPPTAEENLVTDCDHSRFFLKNRLQLAEIPPLNDDKDDDSDESHQTEEEDVRDEEEDLEPRCMRNWDEQ